MNKLLVVAGIAGLAVGGWKLHSHAHVTDGGKLVADRIWIDHMPRGERDMINVFVVSSSESFGIFNTSSRWQGQFEMFKYELKGNELRAKFPQTGTAELIKTTAKKCDRNNFDFCLELTGNKHGVQRYYSMEGWDIDSVDGVRARLTQLQGR